MTWWIPFPESFNHDPRVRALSRAARGVLAQLVIAAKGSGAIPYVNHHGAIGTVLLIALCEGDSRDAAEAIGREYQELVDCRLVSADDAGQRLALHFGQTAEAPRAKEQPSDAPAPAPFRRKPSDAGEATRTRRLRYDFTHRSGPCAGLDSAITWEAWLATPEGAEVFARRVLGTSPNAGTRSERSAGRVPNAPRNGAERVPNASERPPSDSPRSSENTENTENDGAGDARDPNAERPGTRSVPSAERVPLRTLSLDTLADVDTLLDRMREESGGRLALGVSAPQMARDFGRLVQSLVERRRTTVAKVVASARHANHEGWITRKARALNLKRLMDDDGRLLIELITAADTCPDCGGSPLAVDPRASGEFTVPRRAPDEPAEDWVDRAAAEYRLENPLPIFPPGAQ